MVAPLSTASAVPHSVWGQHLFLNQNFDELNCLLLALGLRDFELVSQHRYDLSNCPPAINQGNDPLTHL